MAKTQILIIDRIVAGKTDSVKLTEAFRDAVDIGNGRASSFVYGPSEIVDLARRAERRLEHAGLPQAMRPGFEMTARPAGPWASSYKYSAATRKVTIRRTTKGWVLVSIVEDQVYPKQGESITYRATAAQVAEMQRRSIADIVTIAA